jgi:hypothetical protein
MPSLIPEWVLLLTWFVAGLGATGAFWYFLGQKHYRTALTSAVATIILTVLAISLHIYNDRVRRSLESRSEASGSTPAPAPRSPTVGAGASTTSSQSLDATENNAWQGALANRKDCDAIRTYLRQYPAGHFVAPAQAILAARRPVTEARWVAFEFPANVVASSSLEARTSRDDACNSAHVQLRRNMEDGCSDFSRDSSKYRSVVVDAPANTTCQCEDSAIHVGTATADADPVWRCSIRVIYRCQGEKLERATAYSCD